MPRLLFEKTGNAIWMSHLDLMRVFQRSFKRAGLHLVHSQGYNPRASVSIALPLSLGVESRCELLDFDLEGEQIPCQEIKERLNQALVSGVRVLDVYEDGAKIGKIAYLDCVVTVLILTAQTLSALKKWDCWIAWLLVNIANLTLYLKAGLVFMPIVSCLYLVNGIWSLYTWYKLYKKNS